jgi:predicted MFS family arabinose efflux permease
VLRSLVLVYLASFGGLTTFYLMLGVTPIFAVASGHGDFGGALTTTVFMFATVAAELVTPRIMQRLGNKLALAIGLMLLSFPTLLHLIDGSLALILAVSVVRGAGFALVVIASAAMVASLVKPETRGQALGIYGLVVGIPSIVALPFGVALVDELGFDALFIAAAAFGLLGVVLALVPMPRTEVDEPHGLLHALRQGSILRLAIIFTVGSLASGLLVTYLPIAAGASITSGMAALALLINQLTATITRLAAGRYSDKRDVRELLLPAIAAGVAGLLIILFAPEWILVGAGLFGLAYGVLQHGTLHLMFETAGASGYSAASAIWNIAYDLGLGFGALVFGLLGADYALGVSAALLAIAAIAVGRRSGSSASSQQTLG